MEPIGLLPGRLERITSERNPLMQVHATRRAAQDGYNDAGVVYVAPYTQTSTVQSAHLPLSDTDGRLADFYCVTEGFDPTFNSRNSRGHIVSLASALSFMELSYPTLKVSSDPRSMMNTLVRRTLEGTYEKLADKKLGEANLDMSLVAVLPGDNPETAKVVAANFGGTNVMKYDAAAGTYEFLFSGRSDGSRIAYTSDRGLRIWNGGRRTDSNPMWVLAETEIKPGDELYLLTFVGDAWLNPSSVNEAIISDAIRLRGARHIDIKELVDRRRVVPGVKDISEAIADRVNELDRVHYEGRDVWWDCAVVGVRYMGEDSVADQKAIYANELVKLAGETEALMKLLGNGGSGTAVKLLPAPLQSLVKTDK